MATIRTAGVVVATIRTAGSAAGVAAGADFFSELLAILGCLFAFGGMSVRHSGCCSSYSFDRRSLSTIHLARNAISSALSFLYSALSRGRPAAVLASSCIRAMNFFLFSGSCFSSAGLHFARSMKVCVPRFRFLSVLLFRSSASVRLRRGTNAECSVDF